MRAIAITTVCLMGVASGFGCSSSSGSPAHATGPACNPCDDGGSGGNGIASPTSGHNVNPDGVAYPRPVTGYGHTPRGNSTQAGSVIQNFKFLGYRDGNRAAGMTTISLADYYDPCQKHHKLLHLAAAAVWCNPCNMETDALVAAKAMLDASGVVVVQALDEGNVGVPATAQDLNLWMMRHSVNFTEMLDPGLANLGSFFKAAEIPWNADIDVRTMEILTAGTGYDPTLDMSVPLAQVAQSPLYPIPVSCP